MYTRAVGAGRAGSLSGRRQARRGPVIAEVSSRSRRRTVVSAARVTGAVVAADDLTEGLGLDQALRLHGLEDIAPSLSASALSRDLIQRQRRRAGGRRLLGVEERRRDPLVPRRQRVVRARRRRRRVRMW